MVTAGEYELRKRTTAVKASVFVAEIPARESLGVTGVTVVAL